ncbi:MAG: GNAT family N-acetyltransferase [Acidobacteria bacterium]|nr:MAG: GNAT family N-acetyltransferase [Acidobacteriota bacterium]REK00822.1 MAG: GNAT family N-acetyltransferase [Acidobacteriota bacterium]
MDRRSSTPRLDAGAADSAATSAAFEARIRTLQPGEESRVLALLDGWPFPDGRSGADFFRRAIEHDPRYEARNFVVAEIGHELVSCAQIFPRWLRVRGQPVPTGGIGSVFTAPTHRRRGLASRVLEEAVEEMRRRGHELSLLWASRTAWYGELGWSIWGGGSVRLGLRQDAPAAPRSAPIEIERFDAERHLEAVMELADLYSSRRPGTVLRNRGDWLASLELAGDPHEEFLVVREEGSVQIDAFLRGTMLGDLWCATEWAHDGSDPSWDELSAPEHDPGRGAADLALLIATTQRALGLPALRFPPLRDPALEAELLRIGVGRVDEPDDRGRPEAVWMLRCLAPEALAARFELPWRPGDERAEEEFLELLLPRSSFHFWPADRF